MQWSILSRRSFLVGGVLALIARPGKADDGKGEGEKTALSGVWSKKDSEVALEFDPEGDLTIYPHGEKFGFEVGGSYTVTKEGVVKVKVTRLDGRADVVEKAKELVPVGLEFRFRWKGKGEAATLDDVEGKDIEPLKGHLEGEYASKKS